jgi:Protein of unknown function (DUF1574)
MLDISQPTQENKSSLAQWIYDAIGEYQGLRLRTRLRGNDLHILCESEPCIEAAVIVPRFILALMGENGILPYTNPERPIYKVIIYGRILDAQQPEWVEAIHLNQLDHHWQSWQSALVDHIPRPAINKESSLVISTETMAKAGTPEALARYLSETLSPMGVGVKVMIQLKVNNKSEQNQPDQENQKADLTSLRRLWVICEADYNPDPAVLAEPIAEKLRTLELAGFQDAVITSQVSGETKPDWRLRIDLTPKEEMLKDWARWGDIEAITRLINYHLESQSLQVKAVLKDITLHLFCSRLPDAAYGPIIPPQNIVLNAIAPLLETLAPQGIHKAAIYGLKFEKRFVNPDQEKPEWIEFLDLPASQYQDFTQTSLELAQSGDQEALLFLLHRSINYDMDWRLNTGGVRVSIHYKQDLLHIMTEAIICPQRGKIAPNLAKFVRQLRLPKISGVRIYGRRSGEAAPFWSYGLDFITRKIEKPQVNPQFAITPTWSNSEILPSHNDINNVNNVVDSPLEETPDITPKNYLEKIQQWLLYSQLFLPAATDANLKAIAAITNPNYSLPTTRKIALVWSLLGLLLTLQSDWILGQIVHNYNQNNIQAKNNQPIIINSTPEIINNTVQIPKINLQKAPDKSLKRFNDTGFTKQGQNSVILNNDITRPRASTAAILAAARSNNPTFNNRLLDEKLALYQQRITQNKGIVPDVLIVGSSRAMRGIDPTVLRKTLAEKGYNNVQIFNFGVNGATVKVVDLIIRQILSESNLPKLIIWADGARAFNSSRNDLTYSSIKNSPGYEKIQQTLSQKTTESSDNKSSDDNKEASKINTNGIDEWLNNTLGNLSATYSQREDLRSMVTENFSNITKGLTYQSTYTNNEKGQDDGKDEENKPFAIDFDGYLPLSIRFNPKTYYQRHAKVSGDYDNDYYNFKITGEQEQSLIALLDFLQQKNIPIVFINTPVTREYLDGARSRYERQFLEYMQNIAQTKGLIFKDFSLLFPEKIDYFSDPSHLNQYGGTELSLQIAKDPTIPWRR